MRTLHAVRIFVVVALVIPAMGCQAGGPCVYRKCV